MLTLGLFLLYVPMLVVANASANYIEVYKPAAEKGGAQQLVQSIFTGAGAALWDSRALVCRT